MILSDASLAFHLHTFIPVGADIGLVNPSSIDIRIGKHMKLEQPDGFVSIDMTEYSQASPLIFPAQGFALVDTYETLAVPNGYVIELKLKSSRAREGWSHLLAFHFDPGWYGIGTMEIQNVNRWHALPIWYGMRFGQILIHTLDQKAIKPYTGRYQNATEVQTSKG